MINEHTRECFAIDMAGSIRSRRVIDVLAKLVSIHVAPKVLRSDHGPEFDLKALLQWLARENINKVFIEPEKPWQNRSNQPYNGKFQHECL